MYVYITFQSKMHCVFYKIFKLGNDNWIILLNNLVCSEERTKLTFIEYQKYFAPFIKTKLSKVWEIIFLLGCFRLCCQAAVIYFTFVVKILLGLVPKRLIILLLGGRKVSPETKNCFLFSSLKCLSIYLRVLERKYNLYLFLAFKIMYLY